MQREAKYIKRLGKDLDHIVLGCIDDIYIVFLHYESFEEANLKWNRRKERINYNNLIIKFNDQNGCTKQIFDLFDELDYRNKLFYTANCNYMSNNNTQVVFLEEYKEAGFVIDDMNTLKINMNDYLNSLIIH